MIANSINKSCIISFGLGKTNYECNIGDEIIVYINSIYNNDIYELKRNETNIKSKITNGYFIFNAIETKEIQVEILNKNGSVLKSNKIKLIVT